MPTLKNKKVLTQQTLDKIKDLNIDLKMEYLGQIVEHLIEEKLTMVFEKMEKAKKEAEPLLTITDIAQKFKVTKATVHNWMNRGSIEGRKFGKNRYFTEEEVRKSMAKFGYSKQWENRLEN